MLLVSICKLEFQEINDTVHNKARIGRLPIRPLPALGGRGGTIVSLRLLLQTLMLPRNTITNILRVMFSQISGHFMSQSS